MWLTRNHFAKLAQRTVRHRRAASVIAVAALLGSSVSACSLFDKEEAPPPIINDFLTSVSVPDTDATVELVNEQLGAGSGGPAASVAENATVVNGGSIQQTVTSEDPFTVLRLALEKLAVPAAPTSEGESEAPAPAATSSGAPARGYHQITFAEPTTEATVLLTIAQGLPSDRFLLYYAVVDASGTQGPLATQDVEAVSVGTGDVQVSVSWDVDSDVDLLVVDPDGEVVYWDNETSDSGGELDLDSNAACRTDSVRNENITWAKDTAPAGEYTVRVHLWSSCGHEPSKYVVTINVAGQPTKTHSGTLSGSGDEDLDEDAGEVIATFTVTGSAPSN
jgi:hypothetical protein